MPTGNSSSTRTEKFFNGIGRRAPVKNLEFGGQLSANPHLTIDYLR
jgi:hypothetical protein